MESNIEIIALNDCSFCSCKMVAVKALDKKRYLVQCTNCGAITEATEVKRYKCNTKKVSKLRELKRRFRHG